MDGLFSGGPKGECEGGKMMPLTCAPLGGRPRGVVNRMIGCRESLPALPLRRLRGDHYPGAEWENGDGRLAAAEGTFSGRIRLTPDGLP
jgi:hypothetical protein